VPTKTRAPAGANEYASPRSATGRSAKKSKRIIRTFDLNTLIERLQRLKSVRGARVKSDDLARILDNVSEEQKKEKIKPRRRTSMTSLRRRKGILRRSKAVGKR